MEEDYYNHYIEEALTGRTLKSRDLLTISPLGKPMISFWGEEAGITGGDIHANRAYRIYLRYNEQLVIQSVRVVVEGELISPCSGYRYEMLDEFDYQTVLKKCLEYLV